MPFEMSWHEALPVLVVTYRDELTTTEYRQLRNQRSAILDKGPATVVVLADMQHFGGFPDARKLDYSENIVEHPKVKSQIIVVSADIYKRLSRAVVLDYGERLAVYFTQDRDQALEAAQLLLRQ